MDSDLPFAPRGETVVVTIDDGLVLLRVPLPEPRFPAGVLTSTEEAVARAVFDGASTAEVAAQRGVSERTVSNQLRRVYQKLGVVSRAELVAQCAEP